MQKAINYFHVEGKPVECKVFGHGHINYTYKVTTDTGNEYILQRINKNVFKDPESLMENVSAVSEFLRERVSDPRAALHFIPADGGKFYHRDSRGEYWRVYEFVGGFCLEAAETPEDFYESAIAFGNFQEMLRDFPAAKLHETIPEFHNTVNRYALFEDALEQDMCNRAKSVEQEIGFIMARKGEAGMLQRMREAGELPLRVTHNDTKLNNVLLDRDTRKALCVLDLDTVMPGLSLYDYGDSIRFGASTAAEDEKDLDKVHIDLDLFRTYTLGYMRSCPSMTEEEIRMLPWGARIITLELGVRFLTDYLEGDQYFKTAYPEHNLVRARTQLRLVADMEAHWDEMEAIVREVAQSVRQEQ